MAIVKPISFKESETQLFLYANDRGNFSEYIKQLIKNDMKEVNQECNHIAEVGKKVNTEQKAEKFKVEAKRDDLEI